MPTLPDLITRNRAGERIGTYAVCSAHVAVIDAAVQQALDDHWFLHIESTSSQVNHQGGYTGQTPQQFANAVHSAARRAGLSAERVLLGGDHLGPYPWRAEPASQAMERARELVGACVLAGYRKIHLDASVACADDRGLAENTIAHRAISNSHEHPDHARNFRRPAQIQPQQQAYGETENWHEKAA